MFMTTPVKGGGLWDGVVLVPDVISDFYKAMPDDELDITNLMVVLFVWSCVVVPPFATLALLLADVAELGALPGRVRARALRAVRYLAPWSGAGPLAVCSLFVALEIEQMIAWLFEKTAHRLGVSIDASVFRVSGAVTPLFYGLCAFALVHEGLQLRALSGFRFLILNYGLDCRCFSEILFLNGDREAVVELGALRKVRRGLSKC